ncbi:MAG: DMT family transporter [Rhodospirillaceae bacterium]|jgi:drug/metabolite transporter (DMT)-like permease|nr:DMT family transporter [Rhodospirillaceae bacterium]
MARLATQLPAAASLAPGRGIACMAVGVLIISVNDAVLKWLTADYPIGQVLFMRGLFALAPILAIAWLGPGLAVLRVNSLRVQALRGGLALSSTALFVTGLNVMPFADAVAMTLAGPLFLTALAVPILGEPVGWRRWTAVGIGFIGVLIMVRPGGEAMRLVAIFPLAAALAGAVRDLITRRMSRSESSLAMLFWTTAIVTMGGLTTLPFGWVPPRIDDLGLLIATGFMLASAHYLFIEAFRLAQAAVIAPFKYTNLVWAVIIGLIVWGDLPDAWVFTGAALVVASGLYILHREAVRRRAR